MAKKHLGIEPEDWKRLPWWKRKMYLEGFEMEELIKTSGSAGGPFDGDLTSAGLDTFSNSGFQVRRAGVSKAVDGG